ncbi:MAG TPA: IPT/TIG domain-containing protein [Thermoanaerobaculia bacterium]|nr:IPT/TIG domain-containing protein [Thermoanaerobaculia bacterium]
MRRSFVLLLFLAASASAQPVITSITPNTGKVAGGSVVTINGSGFTTCIICSPPAPPNVLFAGTTARSVTLVDSTTLRVVTPPLLPGAFDVTVDQFGGRKTNPEAYTVSGDPSDGFESVLLPVYSKPVFGAFGSEFHTLATVSNKMDQQQVNVYGADSSCTAVIPAPVSPLSPMILNPDGQTVILPVNCSNWPARLFYVPKDQAQQVTFNDRVLDVTRTQSSNGTEIPIVRSAGMTSGRIVLLNVPIDGRYRNTLRIYALRPTVAFVTTVGEPHAVVVQPGSNIFEPAYAQFSDFPVPVDPGSRSTIRVVIEQPQDIIAGPPMWAFITVTNNETQQITTITPD